MIHFDEADAAAYAALRSAGFEDVVAPGFRALVRGMRATLSYRTVGPARGWCDYLRRRIHIEPSDQPAIEAQEGMHEAMHLAGYDQGLRCFAEDEFADAGVGKLLVPSRGIRSLVHWAGLCPPVILPHYPRVAPSIVLARMGEATDTIAIVHVAGERRVHSCAFRHVNTTLRMEAELVARVRAEGRPVPGPGGVVAWPFLDPRSLPGVVILADLWSLSRAM